MYYFCNFPALLQRNIYSYFFFYSSISCLSHWHHLFILCVSLSVLSEKISWMPIANSIRTLSLQLSMTFYHMLTRANKWSAAHSPILLAISKIVHMQSSNAVYLERIEPAKSLYTILNYLPKVNFYFCCGLTLQATKHHSLPHQWNKERVKKGKTVRTHSLS